MKKLLILLGFIVAKFIIHYQLINPVYELHRDEYLHLDQGRHLAWGYLSVPPFTSWISAIIGLLGNSIFWVKFFPALFGALTIVVVWKTIEALNGNIFALLLGSASVLFSVILRINILYQPNSFDILTWATVYFILVKYIQSQKARWLYLCAVVFAVGFLNKYNIAFLASGLLPAFLITDMRKVFADKHFFLATLAALLFISPNLIWQYQNGFPVFHHMAELERTQLANVNRMDFIKDQLLFFIGSLFTIFAGLFALAFHPGLKKYRVLLWSFIFTLSILIYFKAKGYYAIGLYPVYLAFGSVYLEQLLKDGWKKYLKPALITLPVLLLIPVYKAIFPIESPDRIAHNAQRYKDLNLLKWEDGEDHVLPQDFADMLGWKEIARKTDNALDQLPADEHTIVVCDNYGQAGAINYYSKKKNINAVSFNADYINWFPLQRKINNLLLVKEIEDSDRGRSKEKQLFDSVLPFGSVSNPYAREFGTTIFILKHSKTDINKLLEAEIIRRQNAGDQ